MKKTKRKKEKCVKGFKDTFYFHRLNGLELVGKLELPYISKYVGPLPEKIVDCLKNKSHPEKYFVHFYLFDYAFDGRNGIWYGCQEGSRHMQSYLNKMGKYKGIISPDYSVYVDLPLAHQIWNIYRDRVTCMWLRSMGLNVIFNLRWGDYRTYDIVFSGIEKHSTIAVGSHGLIKHPENRSIFMNGFKEMIRRVEPSTLIIYGCCTSEMEELCKHNNIMIIHFESEQTQSRKEIAKDGRRE